MPTRTIERSAGVLLLLLVAVMIGGLMVGRIGIGADRQYFRTEFPALAGHPDRFATGLVLMAIMGVVMIGAAGALYATFRSRDPLLAPVGAFALLAAGVLFIVDAGAGRAVHDLAREWRNGGAEGDPVWTSARGVALMYEALAGMAYTLLIGAVAALGAAAVRSGLLPRPLGWLAPAGGATVVVGLMLGSVAEAAAWHLIRVGLLAGLLWLLLTGGWLLLRGAAPTEDCCPRDGTALSGHA